MPSFIRCIACAALGASSWMAAVAPVAAWRIFSGTAMPASSHAATILSMLRLYDCASSIMFSSDSA